MTAHLLSGANRQSAFEAAHSTCDRASDPMRMRLDRAINSPECDVEPTGHVLDTLEVALWSFMRSTDLESSLVLAVNQGGDADAVGAVCGTLAGAHWGYSAIPTRWKETLLDSDRLCQTADSLLELALDG